MQQHAHWCVNVVLLGRDEMTAWGMGNRLKGKGLLEHEWFF